MQGAASGCSPLAPSPGIARRALADVHVELMQHVPVCALAYRKGEIHQLMDRQFTECAFHLRVDDLAPVNQDALKTYHWPGNFDELREIAGAIAFIRFIGRTPAELGLGRQANRERLVLRGSNYIVREWFRGASSEISTWGHTS